MSSTILNLSASRPAQNQPAANSRDTKEREFVFIIDPDVKRRASISFYLHERGTLAEPFETIEEFIGTLPRTGVILLFDEDEAIARMVSEVARRQDLLTIVAYAENPQAARIVDAVLAGAMGYAAWPCSHHALLPAIEKAISRSGQLLMTGSRKAVALRQIKGLSSREREILAGMSEGLSNREIAGFLGISSRTVELHRANMLGKIGAQSSAEAVRVAIEACLPPFRPSPVRAVA